MSEQKLNEIPPELREELMAGNVVLFLGDGINYGAGGVAGMPTRAEVVEALAARCGWPVRGPGRLPQVAKLYEDGLGRDLLINALKDMYGRPGLEPGANHRSIARLPVRCMVTTCYDELVERALEQAIPRQTYVRIVEGIDIVFRAEIAVVKLWGDLSSPSTLVVTEDDLSANSRQLRRLFEFLGRESDRWTWVFFGYDFRDPLFNDYYDDARDSVVIDGRHPAYAFGTELPEYVRKWLDKQRISVIDMEVAEGLAALEQATQGVLHRQAEETLDVAQQQFKNRDENQDYLRVPRIFGDNIPQVYIDHVSVTGDMYMGGAVRTAPPDAWDVFISHASEDKETIARPLTKALEAAGLRVWFDEFTLTVGDRLRRSVDKGLANCRYGIVILSPMFFAKEWPQKELDGLVQRENKGEKVILPVWHNISAEQIAAYSPPLADRIAVLSSRGLDQVVAELLRAMGREP